MIWFDPDLFFWLLFLPFGALIYVFRHRLREKNLNRQLGRQKFLLTSSRSLWTCHLKTALAFFALTLFILALARPQSQEEKTHQKKSAGIQIVLAVDVSRSMTAEDIYPGRLGFLKKELARFLDLSAGDQVALVAFSGSSLLISPFTNDLALIKVYLKDLSPDYLSAQGTNFSRVFKTAERVFQNVSKRTQKQIAQALIMASDGEDHSKSRQSALKPLTDRNVRIFTLSVGTNEGGVIPLKNAKGDVMEYKKDSSGKVVVSRLRTKTLKQLASRGKGAYYHLSYSGRVMEKLRNDLDRLEKTVFETGRSHKRKELFQWFLILGLIPAFIELLLNKWRPNRRK